MLKEEKQKIVSEEFDHLNEAVFLNAAHVIIPPKSVLKAYHDFVDGYVSRFAKGIVDDAWDEVDDARKTVAELLNAEPEEIGFVKNTNEAMSILANGLDLGPDDSIVVYDQEHPSNFYPWIRLHEQIGLDLRVVKSRNWDIFEEDLFAACDSSTRIVAVSAVQFTTGVFADLEKIGRFCRRNNIVFAVDGIQAVGRLPVDVKKMYIDYLGCGGNKGLLSMLGAGFVYCRNELIGSIIPPYVSYQSVENFESPPAMIKDYEKIQWKKDARRFESGNLNYTGIAAINAGVKLVNRIGIESIGEHVIELEKLLLSGIKDLDITYRSPVDNIKHLSGILCLYYNSEEETEILKILEKNRIYLTIRGGYIRLAVNFYNSESDIRILTEALHEIFKK